MLLYKRISRFDRNSFAILKVMVAAIEHLLLKGERDMNNIVWYHNRTVAIATEGRKFLHGFVIEADGLHPIKIAKGTRLTEVLHKGEPYPKSRALRHYRRLAKLGGTTKTARKLLRRWAA